MWVDSDYGSRLSVHKMQFNMVFAYPGKPENMGPKVLVMSNDPTLILERDRIERKVILQSRYVTFPNGESLNWYDLGKRGLNVLATGNDKWPIMVAMDSVMCY